MRIIYLTSSQNASGGSRQALYLASGMVKRGHEVVFFTPKTSMLRTLAMAKNISFADLPESRLTWKAALEVKIDGPTVFHAFHNKAVKALAFLGTWWKLRGKSCVCVAHRGVIFPPRNPLPYLLPGIDCFAVNSHACLKTLPLLWRKNVGTVVFNGIPKDKVIAQRNKEDVRAELAIKPDAFVVGCVSNNSPIKGVDILLKGFAKATEKHFFEAVLVLVGVKEEKWASLCKELGITERVRMVSRTEHVADYLQIYTLFVLPSRSESSPNTLLEAMCMGLPALGSRVGGVPEILRDDQFLFTPDDENELALRLEAIMERPNDLSKIAQDNYEFSQNFSLEVKLQQMEVLYENLLNKA